MTTLNETVPCLPRNQSILVIDDSLDALALQKVLLGLEGYEVHTAESGIEALKILMEIAVPNLILLDVQMDDMNGVQFLTLLEEQNMAIIKRVPIVFLSAMDEVPKTKAVGFIRKPVDILDFIAAIQRFIEMGCHPPFKQSEQDSDAPNRKRSTSQH